MACQKIAPLRRAESVSTLPVSTEAAIRVRNRENLLAWAYKWKAQGGELSRETLMRICWALRVRESKGVER